MADLVKFSALQINLDEHIYDDCIGLLDSYPIEKLQLVFRSGAYLVRINVGAFLYSKRTKPRAYTPAYIDPDSYIEARERPLLNWAIQFANQFYRNLRPSSVHENYSRTVMFLDWCDENGFETVLDSIKSYHSALAKYSIHLCREIEPEGKRNTSQRKVTLAIAAASSFFPDHDLNINIGIEHPGYTKAEQDNTNVPHEKILLPALASARGLFESIGEFLSGNGKVPTAIHRHGQIYWFTSCYYPVMSETAILHHQQNGARGKLLTAFRRETVDYITATNLEIHTSFQYVIDRAIERGWTADPAKADRHIHLESKINDQELYKLCKLAHDCFLFMFVLYTEGNESPIATIPWDSSSTVESIIQSFRTIKWRSHSEVELSFEARLQVHFRNYLRIREMLVKEHNFGFLFGTFAFGKSPTPLGAGCSAQIGKQLKRLINPELATIGFRELRAYHHQFKTNQNGIIAAAQDAQHTVSTALNSYQAGNTENNISQTQAFFTNFGLVLASFEEASKQKDSQAGGCNGDLIPARQLDDNIIKPDCKNFLGCLFCDSHLIHFSVEDARKLISMAYIIDLLSQLKISSTEYEQVFSATHRKINWIIAEMEKKASLAAEIKKIKKEIFQDEKLTPYWQNKLRLYTDIGIF